MSKYILLEEAEKLLNDKIEYSHWADKTKIYKETLDENGFLYNGVVLNGTINIL